MNPGDYLMWKDKYITMVVFFSCLIAIKLVENTFSVFSLGSILLLVNLFVGLVHQKFHAPETPSDDECIVDLIRKWHEPVAHHISKTVASFHRAAAGNPVDLMTMLISLLVVGLIGAHLHGAIFYGTIAAFLYKPLYKTINVPMMAAIWGREVYRGATQGMADGWVEVEKYMEKQKM